MRQVNTIILFFVGLGFVYVGNSIDAHGGVVFEAIGTGIELFGDMLIIYSIYRGIKHMLRKDKVK